MGIILTGAGWGNETAKQLSGWDPYNQNASSPFFDPEWMFGVSDGFDVVIGNPPYLREKGNAYRFEVVNKSSFGKNFHQGKMDFWFYFLHKAIDVVKSKGIVSFITSRYWINSTGSSKLINRVKDNLRFLNVVDIGKLQVFDNVAGQHMVAVFCKTVMDIKFIYKKLIDDIVDINSITSSKNVNISHIKNDDVFTDNSEINFNVESNIAFTDTSKLGDLYDTSIGIQESPDKIVQKALESYPNKNINVGDGVFVLSENELNDLQLNSTEKKVIKHYVDPNDVYKYCINQLSKKHIIYSAKIIRERIKKDKEYINLKKHLDKFKNYITSSNMPYGLHRPRDEKYFSQPKIIFKGMFTKCAFALDEKGKYYFGFSFSSIIQKNVNYSLKYLIAILNSDFALWWFYNNGKKRGAGVDIGVEKLRLFPIKNTTKSEMNKIISMVDKIIELKAIKLNADVAEDQLNTKISELYGVTKNDIAL